MGTLALHLTREEIAEYLGLKLETVSRSFSKLRDMRLIALTQLAQNRHVDSIESMS